MQLADREVTVEGGDVSALRLGYAQHAYSAQGRTVDEVYVVTGGWQTDRSSTYVAVSRARIASHVISDHSSLGTEPGRTDEALDELSRRWAISRDKAASIDVASAEIEPQPSVDVREGRQAQLVASLADRWA